MIKKITMLLTGLVLFSTAWAQEENEQYNIAPPSPEVASFMKYGDIPVGHYTGAANISIPLYTIQDDGISIPITLNYHTSGIQVEQEATWVGLGWDLTVGGAITKIPVGEPDESDDIYGPSLDYQNLLRNTPFLPDYYTIRSEQAVIGDCNLSNISIPQGEQDTPASLTKIIRGKGQPDIYQFGFMNHSGKFFLDRTNTLGPYQAVQLNKKEEIDFKGFIPGYTEDWVLRTNDGIKYTFGTIEETRDPSSTMYYPSTFSRKLDRIDLPNGRNILFDYISGFYKTCNCSETEVYGTDPLGGSSQLASDQPLTSRVRELDADIQYLKQVTGTNVIVEFILSERIDMKGEYRADGYSVKKLDRIIVKNRHNNKKIKQFDFTYDYFNYTNLGGDYTTNSNKPIFDSSCGNLTNDQKGKRLKLLSVKEIGYTTGEVKDESKPAYIFTYDETFPLPMKTSYARDYWGYYNGEHHNTTLIPDLRLFFETGQDLGNDSRQSPNLLRQGANRGAREGYMSAGTLKKITYPTGGETELLLEPHRFNNEVAPTADQVDAFSSSSYHLKDSNTPGNVVNQTVDLPNGNPQLWISEIDITRGRTDYTYNDFFANAYISVKGISSTGVGGVSEIQRFSLPNTDEAREQFNGNDRGYSFRDIIINIDTDRFDKISIQAVLPSNIINDNYGSAAVSVRFSLASGVPSEGAEYIGGGLRVNSITSYNGDNPANSIQYIYNDEDGSNSGKLLAPLSFYKSSLYYGCTFIPDHGTGGESPAGRNLREETFSSSSFVPLSTGANGNPIGYDRVIEQSLSHGFTRTKSDDQPLNGKTVYTFFNRPDQTILLGPISVPNIQDYRNGQMLSMQRRNNSGNLISESIFTYTTIENGRFHGITGYKNARIPRGCPGGGDGIGCYADNAKSYRLLFYPLNTRWYLPATTHETVYGTNGGSGLITETTYGYDEYGMQTSNETTNSDGSVWRTERDYPSSQEVISNLRSNYVYNVPVAQRQFVDGVKTFESTSNFGFVNATNGNWGQPTKVITYPRGDASSSSHYDLSYDDTGHLLTVTKDDGVLIQYVWGYNRTRVVAQVTNATRIAIESALGSVTNLNTGGLTVAQENALRDIGGAHSNIYRHDLLRGVTEMTDPNGNKAYYEYDGLGRLVKIRDRDSHTVQQYEYTFDQN